MAKDKNIKKELGAKDRSVASVKKAKIRYVSPYGVVEASSPEEANELLTKLKADYKANNQ